MDDLLTERLILHPLSPAEAERVAAREPGDGDLWSPGYPTTMDTEAAGSFLRRCAESGDQRPFGDYQIRRRDDGRAIGGLGFNGRPVNGVGVIGYGLVHEVRGRGYASEALRRLLEFAREQGLTLVKGDADLDNTASQRVMEAAGMRYVGEDERVRYYEIAWPAPAGAGERAEVEVGAGAVHAGETGAADPGAGRPRVRSRRD
ncbi:hypothetical protein GCM10027168_42660 [Streptomyces capparidis]